MASSLTEPVSTKLCRRFPDNDNLQHSEHRRHVFNVYGLDAGFEERIWSQSLRVIPENQVLLRTKIPFHLFDTNQFFLLGLGELQQSTFNIIPHVFIPFSSPSKLNDAPVYLFFLAFESWRGCGLVCNHCIPVCFSKNLVVAEESRGGGKGRTNHDVTTHSLFHPLLPAASKQRENDI